MLICGGSMFAVWFASFATRLSTIHTSYTPCIPLAIHRNTERLWQFLDRSIHTWSLPEHLLNMAGIGVVLAIVVGLVSSFIQSLGEYYARPYLVH
jgi:hypothetical protein